MSKGEYQSSLLVERKSVLYSNFPADGSHGSMHMESDITEISLLKMINPVLVMDGLVILSPAGYLII